MIYKAKKILVVGGNAAGPAAAAKAKRVNPNAEVILFEAGDYISTGTCELPYLISGEINDYKNLVFFDEESFYKSKGVKVYLKHRVEEINVRKKKIYVKNINDNSLQEYEYDSLVLATGSVAATYPGLTQKPNNAFSLKSISDYLEIEKYLKNNVVNEVVIFGAGYIGLEIADALKKIGKRVTIIEREELPMPGYDFEVRNIVRDMLEKENINYVGGTSDSRFILNDKKISKITVSGNSLNAEMVIFSIGVCPNNSLALSAGLKLGERGGIIVDKFMQTSDPAIFAAGDVVELTEKISGRKIYLPIATLAHSCGHVAGANAGGERQSIEPVVRNIAVKIFDKVISQVGLTPDEIAAYKSEIKYVSATGSNLVKVMPGSRSIFGKIAFDKHNSKIFGAVFVGSGEVTGYADLVSLIITKNGSINDLSQMNYNYTPPVSPFVNILSVLGKKAGKN